MREDRLHLGKGRNHDHRDLAPFLLAVELEHKGIAVHVRHLNVEHDEVRIRFLGDMFHGLGPVPRRQDIKTSLFENTAECIQNILLIINKQNAFSRIDLLV